jgi:ribonuclease HI
MRLTPIDIKIEEVTSLFKITKGRTISEHPVDLDTRVQHWPHPAFSISLLKDDNDVESDLEIYTDGSKTKQGVGAGIAIYSRGTHARSLKYRLHDKCTNNQAEQMEILKSLLHMTKEHSPNKTVTIYTDSQTTLSSLMNSKIHTSLIDQIRLQVEKLEQTAWTIRFSWVRTHVGIQGNELADTPAKEATSDRDISICYDKIPKCVFKSELERISVQKWQQNWNQTTKGNITKNFFPGVKERLNRKLHTTQALTTILTGHGNIKAYLYQFKVIASPTCPCGKDDQNIDHLIYECELLNPQREILN